VFDARGTKLLSKREEDVVRLVAEGMGNHEIAEQLRLSEHGVKNYLFCIFGKWEFLIALKLVLYAVSSPRKPSRSVSRELDETRNVGSTEHEVLRGSAVATHDCPNCCRWSSVIVVRRYWTSGERLLT
jgi:hypothetical protein